jgi:hypothetical protein
LEPRIDHAAKPSRSCGTNALSSCRGDRSTLAVPEGNAQRAGSNSFLRGNQTGISEKREDNAHVAE